MRVLCCMNLIKLNLHRDGFPIRLPHEGDAGKIYCFYADLLIVSQCWASKCSGFVDSLPDSPTPSYVPLGLCRVPKSLRSRAIVGM